MSSPTVQAFSHQARQLKQMARGTNWIGDVYGKDRPSPRKILDFVEALLVCPTESAAMACIAQDPASAEFCQATADDMRRGFDIEDALAEVERPTHETPFYLLASVLLVRARLTVKARSDDWRPKQEG